MKSFLIWTAGFLAFAGFLCAVFGRNMANSAMRGPAMGCCSNLRTFSSAIDDYQGEHDGTYPAQLQELVPKYFQELPRCSRSKEEATSYVFQSSEAGDDYEVRCTADHSHWLFWTDDLNYSPDRFRFFSSVGRLSPSEQAPEWAR